MKVDCLYDVFCDLCGRSMSRDYAVGLCDSVETAVKEAQRVGFCEIDGKRICPDCLQKFALTDQGYDLRTLGSCE